MPENSFLNSGALRFLPLMIAAAILAGCQGEQQAESTPEAPSVQVAAAREQEVRRSAQFVGQIQAVDDAELVARVSGFLETKDVKDGAVVKKDQLLFTIEKAPYKAALLSAKAEVAKAEADAALKVADLERDEDLYQKGHVSKAKYEATLASKEQADAAVEAAQAAQTQAELNLGYTDIKAPFDGRIGKVVYSVGDVVGPTAEPVTRLISQAPVYVGFSVSERDLLNALKNAGTDPNDPNAKDELPNLKLLLPNGDTFDESGRIVFIDNVVDPNTGTISIRGEFENKSKTLVPGTFVTVTIEAPATVEAIVIPQAAIQRDQKGPFVLAINDQEMVEQRYVDLGEQVEGDFVVKDGLQEGTRVIVQGLQKVRPGVPVNAVLSDQPAG
ncbi:efflux RND transporter periplasmic adaptor subunit [Stappia sp. GBMRC 2046]|uniref:Efflux RND transporter periplasmic adaptor subunit n=1 Tax=Stappia sediminis TaxID=2692190 RepID=A0A7X3LXS5_9HYPH|nr:efflux RND transporter periplasmic adaptor subunit [Stappia sediminis]MXN66996.1 efflux RND transporter periplasmic adaptor subunit [Stappia sediminis]